MATLYTQRDSNVRKTWLLMALAFGVIVGIGYIFAQIYGDYSILAIAVVFSLVYNFVSYWYSDKIALSTSGARPVTREQAPALYNVIENLSITAGLPMPRVYVINDPAPNAFATGRNKEHAAVAVTSGLLQMMNKTELEGVIAHELSHIGNNDILLSTVVVVLVGSIALIAGIFRNSVLWGGMGRGRGNRDNGGAGIFILIGIILSILSPIIATLIQLAISRKREFLADASGALLTRYPDGLASALAKIGAYERPMARANNATSHLFISNPFGPHTGVMAGISKLFMTHPPIEERIKALMGGQASEYLEK